VAGWATYRMDLTRNNWRETTLSDSARQWGGPPRNLISFRLDPGNEAERWVMLDSVRLSGPEAGLEEGVTLEPRGTATLQGLRVPATARAGDSLRVTADLTCQAPEGLTNSTGYVRLRRGKSILRVHEQPLALRSGPVTLRAEFPLCMSWTCRWRPPRSNWTTRRRRAPGSRGCSSGGWAVTRA